MEGGRVIGKAQLYTTLMIQKGSCYTDVYLDSGVEIKGVVVNVRPHDVSSLSVRDTFGISESP